MINNQLRNINDHQITLNPRGNLVSEATRIYSCLTDARPRKEREVEVDGQTYGMHSGDGAEAAAPMEVGVKGSMYSEMTIQ